MTVWIILLACNSLSKSHNSCICVRAHARRCARASVQTGSLPSQLRPCTRAISLCLTFTQLPVDRPPLHHFVRGEPTGKAEAKLSFAFFMSHNKKRKLLLSASHPPATAVWFSRARFCSAAVITAINSCEYILYLSAKPYLLIQVAVPIRSRWHPAAGLRNPINGR